MATDVAVCSHCNEAFTLSALIDGGLDSEDFDLSTAPNGAWFSESFDGWTLGATTRSPMAFFLVPFMCVWSGGSLGGIYGAQIVSGKFNLGLSLFGIPFLFGTLLFGSLAVMTVCGRTMVTVDNNNSGRVFTGVGPFGWTRLFDWSSITRIEEEYVSGRHSRGRNMVIVLTGATRLKFGSLLSESRRYFVLRALRKLLAARPAY